MSTVEEQERTSVNEESREVDAAVDLARSLHRTELAKQEQFDLLMNPSKFEHLQRVAKMYAASNLVPQEFQNNEANCAIGIQMAMRLNVDPLAFLQQCYVVKGTPGIEAKLAIALLHDSGVAATRISYDETDDSCTASVTDAITGETKSMQLTWDQVQAEGWDQDKKTKTGAVLKSKWKTMRKLMFRYRSAMWLIRTYYPEVILGMKSVDELEDVEGQQRNGKTQIPVNGNPKHFEEAEKLREAETQTDPQESADALSEFVQRIERIDDPDKIDRIHTAIVEPLGGKDSDEGRPFTDAAARRINALLDNEQ